MSHCRILIGGNMEEFHYDKNDSYESNFNRWHAMNNKERDIFNEPKLSPLEARAVFDDLYSDLCFRQQQYS